MPLKARVTTIDDVEESKRDLYKAVDGGFVIDVEPVDGFRLENVDGLTSTLAKKERDITALKTEAKAWEGIDLDEARDALGRLEEIKTFSKDEKVAEQIRAAEKAVRDQFAKDLDEKDKALNKHTSQIDVLLVDSVANAAIAKHEGIPELLLPAIKSAIRVGADDKGNRKVTVNDAKGQPAFVIREGNAVPKSIDDLVAEWKDNENMMGAFKGTGRSGGGASPGGGNRGGSKTPNPWAKDTFNLTDQSRILKEDEQLATRLKAEAAS